MVSKDKHVETKVAHDIVTSGSDFGDQCKQICELKERALNRSTRNRSNRNRSIAWYLFFPVLARPWKLRLLAW